MSQPTGMEKQFTIIDLLEMSMRKKIFAVLSMVLATVSCSSKPAQNNTVSGSFEATEEISEISSEAEEVSNISNAENEGASAEKGSGSGESGVENGDGAVQTDTIDSEKQNEAPVVLNIGSSRNGAMYEGIKVGWFEEMLNERFGVSFYNYSLKPDGSPAGPGAEAPDSGYDIIIVEASAIKELSENGSLLNWKENNLMESCCPYISNNLFHILAASDDNEEVYGVYANSAQSVNDTEPAVFTWELRYDKYLEIGAPELNRMEDLTEALRKMKEVSPVDDAGGETYGMGVFKDLDNTSAAMYCAKTIAQCIYGLDDAGTNGLYDSASKETYPYLYIHDDGSYGPYLQALKWLNQLYREGLLYVAENYNDLCDKVKQGGILCVQQTFLGEDIYKDAEALSAGRGFFSIVPSDFALPAYRIDKTGKQVWAIAADTEHAGECMKIIDFLASPEGVLTYLYGPEDLNWRLSEGETGNKEIVFTELGEECLNNRSTLMPDGISFDEGMPVFNSLIINPLSFNPLTGERYDYRYWRPQNAGEVDELTAGWRKNTNAYNTEDYLKKNVDLRYYDSDNSAYNDGYDATRYGKNAELIEKSWVAVLSETEDAFESAVNDMLSSASD